MTYFVIAILVLSSACGSEVTMERPPEPPPTLPGSFFDLGQDSAAPKPDATVVHEPDAGTWPVFDAGLAVGAQSDAGADADGGSDAALEAMDAAVEPTLGDTCDMCVDDADCKLTHLCRQLPVDDWQPFCFPRVKNGGCTAYPGGDLLGAGRMSDVCVPFENAIAMDLTCAEWRMRTGF